MPTEEKVEEVERLRKLIEECTVVITADHSGMKGGAMTAMRRVLRQSGVRFHVVKNRLTYLAADAAGKPFVKDIVNGPTGMAFGFEDPVGPAKALTEFIRDTRSPLTIRGGVLGERTLSVEEVAALAALPSKEELLARLAGQLQGPIASLAYVLSAPVSALARVLQRRIEGMEEAAESGPEPDSATVATDSASEEPAQAAVAAEAGDNESDTAAAAPDADAGDDEPATADVAAEAGDNESDTAAAAPDADAGDDEPATADVAADAEGDEPPTAAAGADAEGEERAQADGDTE